MSDEITGWARVVVIQLMFITIILAQIRCELQKFREDANGAVEKKEAAK